MSCACCLMSPVDRLVIYNRAVWPYILISACELIADHTVLSSKSLRYIVITSLGLGTYPEYKFTMYSLFGYIWYLAIMYGIKLKKNTAKPINLALLQKFGDGATTEQKGVSNSVVHQIKTLLFDSVVNQIKIAPLFFSFIDMWSYRYISRTFTLRQIVNINRNKWESELFWDFCWKMVLNCLDCKCLIFWMSTCFICKP